MSFEIKEKLILNKFSSLILLFFSLFILFDFTPLNAEPTGGNIVGGSGDISHSGLSTTINQYTSSMAINWNSFNLSQDEVVNYLQPDSSSIALNRILGNSGSQIHGQINANDNEQGSAG